MTTIERDASMLWRNADMARRCVSLGLYLRAAEAARALSHIAEFSDHPALARCAESTVQSIGRMLHSRSA